MKLAVVLTLAMLPRATAAADAQGCADLKPFPRLEGCAIVECSAKHHDSFDTGGAAGALDADTNTLSYSCPLRDLSKLELDFDARLRKAAYQNITVDRSDSGITVSARKGSQWIRWSASAEDAATSYSLTTANTAAEKLEACTGPPLIAALQQCEISECESKSEDSIGMRTSQNQETPLTGNVQTVTLACPALPSAQAFAAVERDLKSSGFEILFSDREHHENGWITARSGKRWMELASAPDGEAASYIWTVIPSAEELTAENLEPPPVPVPAPVPAPLPLESAAPPIAQPILPDADVPPAPPATSQPYQPVFVYPKPILQVPISPTPERIETVRGLVTIHLLVDVNEEGLVTKAVLTGHISNNVRKLESAALDAVSAWRFEPARQDGRVVACVKIPVEIRFQGRPVNFLSRSLSKIANQ